MSSSNIRDKDEALKDWVSRLPDDILVNIISRLTLKEAARTSVLSSRWKYLWTYASNLNFDASKLLVNVYEETIEEERLRYMCWVNKVLESHKSLSVNEFIIVFDLDDSHESNISHWVYTAISKRAQKFELNLFPALCWPPASGIYEFSQGCYDYLKSPCGLSRVKSLRFLYFDTVNVTEEILEFFINNCPNLDDLRVGRSDKLLRLKVVGSSLQLKCLHIDHCNNLEELEISCPSLLSFKYFGPEIKLHVKNVPQLVDVLIGGGHGIGKGKVIGPIVNYFPQLKTLELHVELNEEILQFPECDLPELRHLMFIVSALDCSSLLGLTCMMKSCPLLQKLTFKLEIFHYSAEIIMRHQIPKHSHQCLKVLEFVGFSGDPVELELAYYMFQNATILEEMIVEPSEYEPEAQAARKSAKKLEKMLPPGVKLVFH
ncbi:F-box domain-containing protein [Citrus sinensis]|uniref:putative F-box/LRR-repeat protein At4g15060 isoform X1 n=2 Tax=Citrus sinensis TaxID=2711 RepID=UPI0003D72190|nr:putative F-box/LRR-repeat protein At4g15060 isoform X1 [Citrus sinensis]KAH9654226.1 F-box domain-containing protein [Citrus sinensis]